VLPTKPSEDASQLLGKIDLPDSPKPGSNSKEYLPCETVEWVLNIDFRANPRLDPKKVEGLFDTKWRARLGGFTCFGLDADTRRWTFAIAADGPRAITSLKLAWDYVSHTDSPPLTPSLFEQRLLEVSEKLHKLGQPTLRPSLPPAEAARRAKQLRELKVDLNQSIVLKLKAPQGQRFDGKSVWDVMLCLGLKWGDMDCFHWVNPTEEGDSYLFSVATTTAPGYFLPEKIAAGRVHVDDLVFVFSIPRCHAPIQVFDAMVRAIEYCQRRLQGDIQDEHGRAASLRVIRSRIGDVEQRLRKAGFIPGAPDTLRLF
jgi:cell division protein ZipA